MSHPMPSDELCAAVRASAERGNKRMIDHETRLYERDRLTKMGIKVPPHTLHDYSRTATEIVIAAIKLRRDSLIREHVDRRWPTVDVFLGPKAMYLLSPVFAALQVEEARLAQLERRTA